MLGLTTYRDYFSDGQLKKKTSLKTESLCIYALDMEETFNESLKIVPSRTCKEEDPFNKFSGLILFDHPTSVITNSGRLIGFTTANISIHLNTLRSLIAYKGPKYLISDVKSKWEYWLKRYTVRYNNDTTASWPNPEDIKAEIYSWTDRTNKFHATRAARKKAIFGDSHAPMLWSPGSTCFSEFGVTLYRALSNGLSSYKKGDLEEAIFCFGNIDLRYHLARQDNPEEATKQLAKEYVSQAKSIAPKVKIASLLPVTADIKGILKTYLYKGEQYFGSFEQRTHLREIFRQELLEASVGTNVKIIDPPSVFETENGMLDDACRENRGVHLCPSKYEYRPSSSSLEPSTEFSWRVA